MMLYKDIIIKALAVEVVPALKEFADKALTALYGPNWYEIYGRKILEHYNGFKIVDSMIEVGIKPLKALDINSLFFLFYPYERVENGGDLEYRIYDGAMEEIGKYYHWTEEQIKSMRRVHTIRNHAVISRYDQEDMIPDEFYRIIGKQEKDWLYELEDLIQIIKPSFHLEEYRKMLAEAVMEKTYRMALCA